ncbi:MAG: replication-associated recombination protein A [Ignavibacteriaceae bacterium]|nr:replication-associated recombination protein A [Ignavibacteriaceae bacterium]
MVPEQIPLAERIRPKDISDFFGQEHLLADGKPIFSMIQSDAISSFILWGPPGTGKTTIAQLIAKKTQSDYHRINAVSSGVKDIREVIAIGEKNFQSNIKTILFIDEIHRFNKSQQDALLNAVETGKLTLIGATTENPSFEVIPALRSRMRIYVLNQLTNDNLRSILHKAIESDSIISNLKIDLIDEDYLLYLSNGDARVMLSIFESAVNQEKSKEQIKLTKEVFENIVQKKNIFYDRSEEHYNVISAFIKSIRGSDPDAALYWMARMLEGGEDPLFIARRMIILASEDIGNASPNALVIAEACFSSIEKIGMPEGRIILAQCATYLASQPKSNASYMAIEKAIEQVKQGKLYLVPIHLRNSPTAFMKSLNYGKGYKYPHDYPDNFTQQIYLPEELSGKQFYYPTENGLEKGLKERLKVLWKNQKKYD